MRRKIIVIILIVNLFLLFNGIVMANEEIATTAAQPTKQLIANGEYQIQSALGGYYLEADGTNNIRIYTNTTAKNQKFYVKYLQDDYYEIYAMNSSKYLDVEGASKANGANVLVWQKNNNLNQKWIIKDAGDGYFNIISKHNGLCLDIYGGIAKSGTNVLVWQKNNNKNQKFKFVKVNRENGTKTLEDGTYKIQSALSTNRFINIADNNNATIYQKTNQKNQRFNVKYLGDGSYQITALHSGKALTDKNSSQVEGTNVIQSAVNNSGSQKWILKDLGDGYCNIISKCNDLYLDVYGGLLANGTNIIMYRKTNAANQKFKFIKSEDEKGTKTIEDGIYNIKSKLASNKSLDVTAGSTANNANIEIWASQPDQHQKFQVTYLNNGYYSIEALNSGKRLDVAGANTEPGANIIQYDKSNGDNQKWIIRDTGDGYFNIISKCNNLYLDIEGASTANGANVLVWEKNGNNNQKFKFEKVEQIQVNGQFEIVTAMAENKVLDVYGASNDNKANISLYEALNNPNQNFVVEYKGNQEYIIYSNKSKKLLTVDESTGNVYQYENKNTANQRWLLEYAGNASYYIISKANGKCLDVTGQSTSNNANIEVYTRNNGNNQRFIFRKFGTYYKKKNDDAQKGTYGKSGALARGRSDGSELEYYKVGNGPNVFFATFCVHGFEDSWNSDGTQLVLTGQALYDNLVKNNDRSILDKWTIYILPEVNPDGRKLGNSCNGPGRRTLYSDVGQGIDLNRCWQTEGAYQIDRTSRNYNGTAPMQAEEARAIRDFLLSHKSTKGQNVLVDLHGWENQLIGDAQLGNYYYQQYANSGIRTSNYGHYGTQYLIKWARQNIGARTLLVELPQADSPAQFDSMQLSTKYINATLNMLKGV